MPRLRVRPAHRDVISAAAGRDGAPCICGRPDAGGRTPQPNHCPVMPALLRLAHQWIESNGYDAGRTLAVRLKRGDFQEKCSTQWKKGRPQLSYGEGIRAGIPLGEWGEGNPASGLRGCCP